MTAKNHSMTRYQNGGNGYAEFECGSCGVDMDMFDFELAEIVAATEGQHDYQCVNCFAVRPVSDVTPITDPPASDTPA